MIPELRGQILGVADECTVPQNVNRINGSASAGAILHHFQGPITWDSVTYALYPKCQLQSGFCRELSLMAADDLGLVRYGFRYMILRQLDREMPFVSPFSRQTNSY